MQVPSIFLRLGILALAMVIIGTTLLPTRSTSAASTIVDLGKPADVASTNNYFPLSGFHRVGKSGPAHGKVRLVFIGTLSTEDSRSAVERWPVVKALDQFGQFTGVKAVDMRCSGHGTTTLTCPGLPTFDWSHARYRSNYVAFDHKDILGLNGSTYFQRLSTAELALYNRYARVPLPPGLSQQQKKVLLKRDPYAVMQTVTVSTYGQTSRGLPLIGVGGYVQTVSQVVQPGDFEVAATPPLGTPQAITPAIVQSFATIENDLRANRDPAGDHLAEDVNAEANIMTALICHADGMKPKNVCGRSVIKAILKDVK